MKKDLEFEPANMIECEECGKEYDDGSPHDCDNEDFRDDDVDEEVKDIEAEPEFEEKIIEDCDTSAGIDWEEGYPKGNESEDKDDN